MKQQFLDFQESFVVHWQKYRELLIKLDEYRGKEIGDDYAKVNILLNDIQDTYTDMYPAIEFVIHNYNLCVTTAKQYTEFIEDLKKSGATTEHSIIDA